MRGQRFFNGASSDDVPYSGTVPVGVCILISGTIAIDEGGEALAPGDLYEQAKHSRGAVVASIEELGGEASDVVRTRMYVTGADEWDEVGRAHREVVGEAKPATTLVEVQRLVDERMLVEVEAEAVSGASLRPAWAKIRPYRSIQDLDLFLRPLAPG